MSFNSQSTKKCNYLAPMGRIIIAWSNAPSAGVYDLKPFLPRKGLFVVIVVKRALPWALIKRPFRAE